MDDAERMRWAVTEDMSVDGVLIVAPEPVVAGSHVELRPWDGEIAR